MSTSKSNKNFHKRVSNQVSLLDIWESLSMEPGSMDIRTGIAGMLSKAISTSRKSRYEIAAQVSELVGRDISKSTLDAWTAESKEDHRLPADVVPALCFVLHDFSLLRLLGKTCGCNVLEYDEAIYAEIAKKERLIRELMSDKERLQVAALRYKPKER